MTRALVVGAGSIGSRHVSILSALGHEVAVVSRRTDLTGRTFSTLGAALDGFNPDYVVVATETDSHAKAVKDLVRLDYHGDLLIEKPLSVRADLFEHAAFGRVGVGYNLRFHPVMTALTELLADHDILTVEAYAGQHLSTWRPDRPVEEQYSGSRARGGGVLRDLSHELDYLGLLLGECKGVFARGGRLSTATVDADDAWGIVSHYERAPLLTLQLNYLDTRARRRLVMNTGTSTIEADFIASTLRVDEDFTIYPTDRDASYRSLHEAMLGDATTPVTTVGEAIVTDELIAMIEKSAEQQKWIERP